MLTMLGGSPDGPAPHQPQILRILPSRAQDRARHPLRWWGEVCCWEYLLIPVRTIKNSKMPPLCACHPAQGPQPSSPAPREEADSFHTPRPPSCPQGKALHLQTL